MNLAIDEIEALWIVSTLGFAVVALAALRDALADRADVRRRNGPARTIVAQGDVRRERLRVVVALLLAAVVIPGLTSDRPTDLNVAVLALIVVPLVLLVSTALDLRDRRRLARFTTDAISAERAIAAAAESALARVAAAADSAADKVRSTAVMTAGELAAAAPSVERGIVAAERTAKATERIADAGGPSRLGPSA